MKWLIAICLILNFAITTVGQSKLALDNEAKTLVSQLSLARTNLSQATNPKDKRKAQGHLEGLNQKMLQWKLNHKVPKDWVLSSDKKAFVPPS